LLGWRYKRGIQGYVSSGDAFYRRFDAILSYFERKERVVDDTLYYDFDFFHHWWRTIDFLATTRKSGIVLNPSKFQFAERIVDFAGFRRIDPLSKYFNAIRNFPTPSSTTDIKNWFGLSTSLPTMPRSVTSWLHFDPSYQKRSTHSCEPMNWTKLSAHPKTPSWMQYNMVSQYLTRSVRLV